MKKLPVVECLKSSLLCWRPLLEQEYPMKGFNKTHIGLFLITAWILIQQNVWIRIPDSLINTCTGMYWWRIFRVYHGCLRQIMLLLSVMPALDIIRGAGIFFWGSARYTGVLTVSKGPPDVDFISPKKEIEKSVVNKYPFWDCAFAFHGYRIWLRYWVPLNTVLCPVPTVPSVNRHPGLYVLYRNIYLLLCVGDEYRTWYTGVMKNKGTCIVLQFYVREVAVEVGTGTYR